MSSKILAWGCALGLALCGWPGAARAQEPAPWDVPEARQEAARVVREGLRLLASSEARDARPAAELLRDPHWLLRLLAATRLRTLGLDAEIAEQLMRRADPAAGPPPADWPALEVARGYAEALDPAPGAGARPPREAALEALIGAGAARLVEGPEPAASKLRMLRDLLALRTECDPASASRLGVALTAAVDEQRLSRELGLELGRALLDGARPVLDWLGRNLPWLAWNAEQARFEVDLAARQAGVPSDEFRRRR